MKIAYFDVKDYDINTFKKYDITNQFAYYNERLTLDNIHLVKGFDTICVFVNDVIDKTIIDKLMEYQVKLILLRCAGFNNVDLDYIKDKISVYHVPQYSPNAVAEYAMALILTLVRKTHKAYSQIRNFNFELDNLIGFNLQGKTLGIIGTGKIGRALISIAKGFGMNVIAYDVKESEGIQYVSLNELYKQADIISLHCPLNDESYHMINADSISLMAKQPIIINTSRGGLINSTELLNALKNKQLSGACLDVYEDESELFYKDHSSEIIYNNTLLELINLPNVIVTSHQAYLTKEALDSIARTTILNYYNHQNHISTNKIA